jgi:hypothetical protein
MTPTLRIIRIDKCVEAKMAGNDGWAKSQRIGSVSGSRKDISKIWTNHKKSMVLRRMIDHFD